MSHINPVPHRALRTPLGAFFFASFPGLSSS